MLIGNLSLRETGLVPEFCTCGAQLPEDARFCHKCGKPQREEPLPVEQAEQDLRPVAQAEPTPAPAIPHDVGLRNMAAVRVALLVGTLAFLASLIPVPVPLRFLFLLGAGTLSVLLYVRRTGFPLELRNAVRMGWITGLFCFVFFTVLFTISVAALSYILRDPSLEAAYRSQLDSMGMSRENVEAIMEALQSPLQILGALASAFFILTVVPAIGGALGALLLRRN